MLGACARGDGPRRRAINDHRRSASASRRTRVPDPQPQLIRYAGYRNPDGPIIGDPAHVDITEVRARLGCKEWHAVPAVANMDRDEL